MKNFEYRKKEGGKESAKKRTFSKKRSYARPNIWF